jgi:hypothetical protein
MLIARKPWAPSATSAYDRVGTVQAHACGRIERVRQAGVADEDGAARERIRIARGAGDVVRIGGVEELLDLRRLEGRAEVHGAQLLVAERHHARALRGGGIDVVDREDGTERVDARELRGRVCGEVTAEHVLTCHMRMDVAKPTQEI